MITDFNPKKLAATCSSSFCFRGEANIGCSENFLVRMARRTRQASNRHPSNPTSLEHLVIPSSYLTTNDGGTLLRWDSGYFTSLRRSFLFGTEDFFEALSSSPNFVIDGTFKTAPNLFTQLLTVHGLLEDSLCLWTSPWEGTDSLNQPAGGIGHTHGLFRPESVFTDYILQLYQPDDLEHSLTELKIVKHLTRTPPPPRQKKWINYDHRFQRVVGSYDQCATGLKILTEPEPDRIGVILTGTGPDNKLEKVNRIRPDWPDLYRIFKNFNAQLTSHKHTFCKLSRICNLRGRTI